MANKRRREDGIDALTLAAGDVLASVQSAPPAAPLSVSSVQLPQFHQNALAAVKNAAAIASTGAIKQDIKPSASSSSSSSSSSKSNKYWLSIVPPPPRFPFVGVYFPINLYLVDSKKVMKNGWPLNILVEVLYENGELVPDQSLIQIHPDTIPRITGEGSNGGSVALKLRMTRILSDHRNLFLRFTARYDSLTPVPAGTIIQAATSTLMTVIKYKLKISEQPPNTWYKDEGGRDKCISISGLMVDDHDNPVTGREIPLRVSLCYEGEDATEVKNQSILKMPTDAVSKIDKYGRVSLKVRIEEVSKNHQKQAFCVRLAPDLVTGPNNYDIAPITSSSIVVLSKRNKRRKKEHPIAPTHLTSTSSLHHQSSITAAAIPSLSAANSLVKKIELGRTTTPALAASTVPRATPSLLTPQASSITAAATALSRRPSFLPNGTSTAVNNTINWCQHVMRLLNDIEWQHIGFETTVDGNINLHRPLYRCPGCWVYKDTLRPASHAPTCMISRLGTAYHSSVSTHLQELLAASSAPTTATAVPHLSTSASTSSSSNSTTSNATAAVAAATAAANVAAAAATFASRPAPSHSAMLAISPFPNPNAAALQFPALLHQLSGGGLLQTTSFSNQMSNINTNANNNMNNNNNSNTPGRSTNPSSRATTSSSSMPPPASLPNLRAQLSQQQQQQLLHLQQQISQQQQQLMQNAAAAVAAQSAAAAAANANSGDSDEDDEDDDGSGSDDDDGNAGIGDDTAMKSSSLDDGNNVPALGLMQTTLDSLANQNGVPNNSNDAFSNSAQQGAGGPPLPNLPLVQSNSYAVPLLANVDSIDMTYLDSLNNGGGNVTNSSSLMSTASMQSSSSSYYPGGEESVDAIHVSATSYGFPAFNNGYQLIGFYRHDENTSYLEFVSLSLFPRHEQMYKEITQHYVRAREASSSQVLTRASCITLDNLREQVLLLHYAAGASSYLN